MSTEKTDIAQIRKYLSGELDARAMYELERRALDDPFLMDALEGYESSSKIQQPNLSALDERLQQRLKPTIKRVALWPKMAIAASILLFLSLGGLWLLNQKKASSLQANHTDLTSPTRTEIRKKINDSITPSIKTIPLNQNLTVLKPAGQGTAIPGKAATSNQVVNEQNKRKSLTGQDALADLSTASAVSKDSTSKSNMLAEVTVTGYATQKKRDVTGSVTTITVEPVQQALQGRATGVDIATKDSPGTDSAGRKLITGQVLSKTDGSPLPGAVIALNGKDTKVLTDAQGRFSIQAAKQDELRITYIGFRSEQVKVKGQQNLKVLLSENQNTLSEVVIVADNNQQNIKQAHPAGGWSAFNRYLKENARSPDGIQGTVRLRFTVNPDNSLDNFEVVKSLSPEADKKAIELVQKGPSWVHNQDGKPEVLEIKVRF